MTAAQTAMRDAADWLTERVAEAPEKLSARMIEAIEAAGVHASIQEQLAHAALVCLQRAVQNPSERTSALDLLAADALLTHACEAASGQGSEALTAFAAAWDARRFEKLLQTRDE